MTAGLEDVPDRAFALICLIEALGAAHEVAEAAALVSEVEALAEQQGGVAFAERARSALAVSSP